MFTSQLHSSSLHNIGLLRSVPWADRQGQAAADRDRAAESKRRPNQGPVRDSEIVAPGITRRLVRIRGRIFFRSHSRPTGDRWFADSSLEGDGFEPVWGFSCQAV